jgi:Na+/melibiose symporter-like transporter
MLFSAGIGASVALFALPMILRLIGVLPMGSEATLPVLQATNGLAGFFLGIVMIVSAVMASETAEDYETQTGIKATAMLFGFVFLAMKTASGLGKLLAGVIIDVIALPAARDAKLITPAQMDALGAWSVGALLCLGTLGVIAFSKYRSPARG